jgi:hypothetical protein
MTRMLVLAVTALLCSILALSAQAQWQVSYGIVSHSIDATGNTHTGYGIVNTYGGFAQSVVYQGNSSDSCYVTAEFQLTATNNNPYSNESIEIDSSGTLSGAAYTSGEYVNSLIEGSQWSSGVTDGGDASISYNDPETGSSFGTNVPQTLTYNFTCTTNALGPTLGSGSDDADAQAQFSVTFP